MKRLLAVAAVLAALVASTRDARAQAASATSPAAPARSATPAEPPPAPPPATAPASAPPFSGAVGQHDHSLEFELHGVIAVGGFPWPWAGFGTGPGFRLGIPLLRNGFLSRVNNDLRINFGADVFVWVFPSVYVWLTTPIVLQWNLFLAPKWSLFFEAGVALDLYPPNTICYDHQDGHDSCDLFGFWPVGGAGVRYHWLGDGRFPALTIRLEYPTGINVGVSF